MPTRTWSVALALVLGCTAAPVGPNAVSSSSGSVGSSTSATTTSSEGTGSSGGASTSTSAPSPTADEACAAYAEAFCAAYARCTPWLLEFRWGDEETCRARTSLLCPLGFTAPGSTITPLAVATCTNVFATLSCAQLASGVVPVACRYSDGTRGLGESCIFPHQCHSGVCRPTSDACGECVAPAGEGEDCDATSDCAEGLVCNGAFCLAAVPQDGECGAVDVCAGDLVCDHGFCDPPGQLDGECNPDAPPLCDARQGRWCSPSSNRCTEITQVGAGQSCGQTLSTLRLCRDDGFCRRDDGAEVGECVAPAADGAACDDELGPHCRAPAACVAGTCTLPDVSACD